MARAFMPFYVGDFLADTMHLGAAERGIYISLILHCWQHGSIPRDSRKLARIGGCDSRLWHQYEATVLQFFDVVDAAAMEHKRVSMELRRYAEKRNKCKDAAQQMHAKQRASAHRTHMQSQSQSQNSSSSTPARELVSREAVELADAVAVMCGHDLKFVPPQWSGAALQVDAWFKQGWPPDVIKAAIKKKLGKLNGSKQVTSTIFFEACIADLVASLATPVPVVKPGDLKVHKWNA